MVIHLDLQLARSLKSGYSWPSTKFRPTDYVRLYEDNPYFMFPQELFHVVCKQDVRLLSLFTLRCRDAVQGHELDVTPFDATSIIFPDHSAQSD